jgi:hypothetical protein
MKKCEDCKHYTPWLGGADSGYCIEILHKIGIHQCNIDNIVHAAVTDSWFCAAFSKKEN